jgi:DNA modification methylase
MVQILQGDCRAVLPTLAAGSVQMCVTSPPYFGLRDYGVDGQLGLEATPDLYIAALVEVFRGVRRVLRDDGVLWLNLGDSHCNKQLLGIPWRVAFALQADGWILRSDCIWSKPNVMPESVRDRPTKSHEYLFLLSKHERYFYDADAIREPVKPETISHNEKYTLRLKKGVDASRNDADSLVYFAPSDGRNKRSVWTVATTPYKQAHYATFPEKLIEPCVLAGTSPQACEVCRAPWERVVERGTADRGLPQAAQIARDEHFRGSGKPGHHGNVGMLNGRNMARSLRNATTGWQPTCDHDNAGTGRCIVLDPFGGSGTTARVAAKHQRDAILIELNPSYIEQAQVRTDNVQTSMTSLYG